MLWQLITRRWRQRPIIITSIRSVYIYTSNEFKKRFFLFVFLKSSNNSGTSVVPVISSPQLCHCGQRSLSWNVIALDVQQQCSWLNQKPTRQMPSFISVSQWAAMSMPPARAPALKKQVPSISAITRYQIFMYTFAFCAFCAASEVKVLACWCRKHTKNFNSIKKKTQKKNFSWVFSLDQKSVQVDLFFFWTLWTRFPFLSD